MRVIDLFDKGAEHDPDRDFLVSGETRRTFREVQALSHRIANGLHALGATKNTKIAIYSPNSARAFECVIGILRAGAVWCGVNTRSTVDEIQYIMDNSDVEVMFYGASLAENVATIKRLCPKIKHFISFDGEGPIGRPFDQWIAGASNLTWETAAYQYSMNQYHEHPVHLVVAPMTHGAGCVTLGLMQLGTTNIILPGFDAAAVLDAIEEHRVTHAFLPPTAFYMLLGHPTIRARDYSSLKYFLYSAAPMSVARLKECIGVFGPVMCQIYAQMEALLSITYMSPKDHDVLGDPVKEKRLASCGRPCDLTRLEIMDNEGRILPIGERGEIVIQSNIVMAGYYRNPEETAAAFRSGWLHTGDVGYKDEDGFVYIVDRSKNMIISGGFNIYPNEIEQVITTHPDVQECAVIGVPDEKWGEAVKAIVVLKNAVDARNYDFKSIETHCRGKLPGYKVPKSFEIWPELPRTAVGKIQTRAIRERYWKNMDRAV
ncbi:MAG: AMP-binding protein [Betaproteobacteria bacterium]|nr:AMP-binding protein [Betaproteobacteria bacterium]